MRPQADGPGEDARARADRRLGEALERTALPDPRNRYRAWLRELRDRDEAAFRKALEYYEKQLVPGVADPRTDPIREWTEYGIRLAARLHPGSLIRVDETGRARGADADAPPEELLLHLPRSSRETALAVRIPAVLSPAQEAAYELLVQRSLG